MRPLPQSFIDRVRLLCTVHEQRVVADLLGIQESQISVMKRRGWKAAGAKPRRPMPSDFAIQSRHMTNAQLAHHYKAGHETVQKWFAELPGRRPPMKYGRWSCAVAANDRRISDKKTSHSQSYIEISRRGEMAIMSQGSILSL